MSTLEERVLSKLDRSGGDSACWPFGGSRTQRGYGRVRIRAKNRVFLAHRLAYEFLVGPIPPGYDILHSCDNPPCCNPAHLRAGTDQDNIRDKVERGRAQRLCGETNGCAKVTDADVLKIRELYETGEWTYRALGAVFGISKSRVFGIVKRLNWRHL